MSSHGSSPSHPASPKPGQMLAGKYRVERVLGVGGMGLVVAARHVELDERVAVKLMLPEALGNSDAVARFVREAKAAVKIKSEHIARVSDVGKLESGEPYIVMEYLEGTDLDGWLRERGPLALEQAAEFVIQACEALAEAHTLGIVHRDLKPANLFCVRRADGLLSIKILDFGISKATLGSSGSDFQGTQTRAVMGSPLYMSPEQLDSPRNVDARGDIWALGAVLYELVTGRPPFQAESLPGLVLRITQHVPAPVRSVRAELPLRLDAVILRCLQKDREQRYRNVAELAQALAEFAPERARASVERVRRVIESAGAAKSVLEPPTATQPPESFAPTLAAATQSSFGQTSASKRGVGRRWLALLGLLALAVVGAATVLLLHAPAPARPEPVSVASTPSTPNAASAVAPVPAPAAANLEPVVAAAVESGPHVTSSAEPPALPSAKAPVKKAALTKAPPPSKPSAALTPAKKLNGLIEDRN